MDSVHIFSSPISFIKELIIYQGGVDLVRHIPNPIYGNFWQPNIGFLKMELISLALSILSDEQEKLSRKEFVNMLLVGPRIQRRVEDQTQGGTARNSTQITQQSRLIQSRPLWQDTRCSLHLRLSYCCWHRSPCSPENAIIRPPRASPSPCFFGIIDSEVQGRQL